MTIEKLCKKCGISKPTEAFTLIKSGKKKGMLYSYCRPCERKTDRERKDKSWAVRKLKEDKTRNQRSNKWKANNQEKVKAHRLAQKIPIPKVTCAYCLENIATERHHEDYSKPLDVVFLCDPCHNKTRRKDG